MKETIYIKLLDEDVEVWRPVFAKKGDRENLYFVLSAEDNELTQGELLKFPLESYVLVKEVMLEGKKSKVSYTSISS